MLLCRPRSNIPKNIYKVSKNTTTSRPQVRKMAFFPRFPANELAPLFRLLDDYDVHRSGFGNQKTGLQHVSSFSPRFDVRELKDGYHLDGELPGINQQDVEIEFTDPHTLVIKGRSEREYTTTTTTTTNNNNNNNNNVDETPESTEESQPGSPKSLQATVEDEKDDQAKETAVAAPSTSKQVSKPADSKKHKFWVSERSVGHFHRTFSFPTRVDQDNVTANLKNGILSIVVPKAAPPVARKITIG